MINVLATGPSFFFTEKKTFGSVDTCSSATSNYSRYYIIIIYIYYIIITYRRGNTVHRVAHYIFSFVAACLCNEAFKHKNNGSNTVVAAAYLPRRRWDRRSTPSSCTARQQRCAQRLTTRFHNVFRAYIVRCTYRICWWHDYTTVPCTCMHACVIYAYTHGHGC